jgi:hypothetical protein
MARLANAWARAWRGLAALILLAAVAPAWAQPPAGAPTSILPDVLDEDPAAPGEPEAAAPILPPDLPAPEASAPAFDDAVAAVIPPAAEEAPPDPLADLVGPLTLPENAGLLDARNGGLPPDLFAASDARFAGTLLRRLDAPVASRWVQILLTRALLTRATPPQGLNPGDWLAARGEALVAIGAAADAHRMIARVLPDRYTEGLYRVAANAAIASGDPIALCPLSPTARSLFDDGFWTMTDAMCLSIAGDEFGASQLFDRLRRQNEVAGFDIGLAERLSSAVGGGRRGANPEWGEVDRVTAWRIGLASAAGLDVPDTLVAAAGPAEKAWIVRLAGQSLARRAALAPAAAAIGAISSAEIGRILAAEAATLDPGAVGESPGGQLRTAMLAADPADRQAALAAVLARGDADTPDRYGWTVAAAAATVQP